TRDFRPDMSFYITASPECMSGLARASSAGIIQLCFSFDVPGSCMNGWKSCFFLIDRRDIPDYMPWMHPNSAIDDPKPLVGSYNQEDVRRRSAHVVKLRDIPGGVGFVWLEPGVEESDPIFGSEELHRDIRPTLQRLPFYFTLHATADVSIPDPTLEDLAVSAPSVKVMAKAEYSKKRMALLSWAAPRHVAKRTRLPWLSAIPTEGNQSDGSAPLVAEGLSIRGKAIMTDASDPFPEVPVVLDLLLLSVAGSCKFSYEEWDAPHQPTLTVLKEVFKDPTVCKTIVDQFLTPKEMVRIEALTNDQLTAKMSVLHCLMTSYRGELLA
nr:hypothetical protein [Tanacetum cinerariifolium]